MTLNAINDSNDKAVDWWFAYKLPHAASAPNDTSGVSGTTGFEYLYYDSQAHSPLQISPHRLNQPDGALHQTLAHIFDTAKDASRQTGWILYNDEAPGRRENNESKGHCKGILSFDPQEDRGIWLIHSTPRFPIGGSPDFPEDEKIYAQTFICLTLENYATANLIARQLLHQHDPQVYDFSIPTSIPDTDFVRQLSAGVRVQPPTKPSELVFHTKGQKTIHSIGKNRHWAEDFWIDLVGPYLKVNLNVETWRRGRIPSTRDSNGVDDVVDVTGIDLSVLGADYSWPYTKDHAKWAVSTTADWVCIADINRQVSQEKRGGGCVCFNEPGLWHALSLIEVKR